MTGDDRPVRPGVVEIAREQALIRRFDAISESIRGLHQGQQSSSAARTGRTHACTRTALISTEKPLAPRRSSTHAFPKPHLTPLPRCGSSPSHHVMTGNAIVAEVARNEILGSHYPAGSVVEPSYPGSVEEVEVVKLPAIVESYVNAYNCKDVAALVACVSDQIVFENVSNSDECLKIRGREAFADLAERSALMFIKRKLTIRHVVVDGDHVALWMDWAGTPAIDLGTAKAGKPIAMRAASFMTVAEGLLTRIVDLS